MASLSVIQRLFLVVWTRPWRFACAQSCDGTRATLEYDGATGTTCSDVVTEDATCTLQCAGGLEPLGSFFCLSGYLFGVPKCEAEGTSTAQVTRVAGHLHMSTVRKRTPRMGLEFRDLVRVALAHSLVISPSDFDRLEVSLSQPAIATEWSTINIKYEIQLSEASWQYQVTSDLNMLASTDSSVRLEFEGSLGAEYPIGEVNVVLSPITFRDIAQDTSYSVANTEVDSGSDYVSVVIAAGLLMLVVFFGVACYSSRHYILNTAVPSTLLALPEPAPEVHE